MADTPTTMPKAEATAKQKAALPKLLVPATIDDLRKLLWEYAQKAVPQKDAAVTPEQKIVADEIAKIATLNAWVGRGDAKHNCEYFRAVLKFIETYSVGEQEQQKAKQLAALIEPDEKKRHVAFASEDDVNAKEMAKAMVDFKTGATKNGEASAEAIIKYSKKFSDAVSSFFGSAVKTAKEVAADAPGMADRAKSVFDNFMNTISAGGVVGGAMGLAGAYLLGGFFGEGIFTKILTLVLAVPMLIIGSKWGKETIDTWLNPKAGGAAKAQDGAQQAQQRGDEKSIAGHKVARGGKRGPRDKNAPEAEDDTASQPPGQVLTQEELTAILSEGKGKRRPDLVRMSVDDPQAATIVRVDRVAPNDRKAVGLVSVDALRQQIASCVAAGDDGIVFTSIPGGARPGCGRAR